MNARRAPGVTNASDDPVDERTTSNAPSRASLTSCRSAMRLRASFSKQSSSVRRTEADTSGGSALKSALPWSTRASVDRHVLTEERGLAREHLVQHTAKRPNVGAPIDSLTSRLLRAHVRSRAEHHAHFSHRRCRKCGRARAGRRARVERLAIPKSSTFTKPSGRSLMFAGLRSRCTMPRSCAASSASATWPAILSASSTGSGPSAYPVCERRALDQLHRERRVPSLRSRP